MALSLGFSERTGESSSARIDIKVPAYKPGAGALYILIPSLFDSLRNVVHIIPAQEKRIKIVSQFAHLPFADLAVLATEVFKHAQHKLPGKPTEAQWQAELQLWEQEHAKIQRGY